MKLIPKSVAHPQILWLLIRIVLTCFFHHLLLSRIIEHGMSRSVNWTPHDHPLRVLDDIGSIKLLKVRSSWASTRRNGVASPLQILLFLDQLLSPPPVSDTTPGYCTAIALAVLP
jgi:hypothetical protein